MNNKEPSRNPDSMSTIPSPGPSEAASRRKAKVAEIAALVLLACVAVWMGMQKSVDSRRADQQAGETRTITLPGGATMEMVWCPPGSFTMGSPENEDGRWNDETQHRVTLTKGFWLAKTEVTQKQWKGVMGNNPSWLWFEGDDLPVGCVSWNDCREFCRKTGLQLPTEAQWEYACRAGSTGPYAGIGTLEGMGWYDGNSGDKPHPVGQKRPNAWGLLDMHGNVGEWCQDYWQEDLGSAAQTDPKGPGSGSSRVCRGGSWSDIAGDCRSAYRNGNSPGHSGSSLGFRPARESIP